jgi:hypothetical protein
MFRRALILTACAALAASLAGTAAAQGRGNDGAGRDNPSTGAPPPGLQGRPLNMPPGQYKKLVRGQRLPDQYWAPQYYLTDYRTYQLREPPNGYRWMRVDDTAYLVRNNTAIITQVIDLLLN